MYNFISYATHDKSLPYNMSGLSSPCDLNVKVCSAEETDTCTCTLYIYHIVCLPVCHILTFSGKL